MTGYRKDFPLHHRIHAGSGTIQTTYPVGTRGSLSGDKLVGS